MKIAVCIKQVVTREWQLRVNEAKTWIRDQDASFELNEPDAYALEEALRLKEKHSGEVVVVSAGPARAAQVIVIGTTLPEAAKDAAVLLPITNVAEEEGTFTNLRGRVQRFMQAKPAPGLARPSWLVLGDLLGALGKQDGFYLPSDVFTRIAETHPAFSGLSYDTLGMRGLPVLDSDARTTTRMGEGLGMGQEATR